MPAATESEFVEHEQSGSELASRQRFPRRHYEVMDERNAPNLLSGEVRAINVGLEVFYQTLLAQGVAVVHVDWRPPAGGDAQLASILDRLSGRKG